MKLKLWWFVEHPLQGDVPTNIILRNITSSYTDQEILVAAAEILKSQRNVKAKNKLSNIYDTVKTLLIAKQDYRDSDNLLVVRMWYDELKLSHINAKDITAIQFMEMYRDEKLTSADTITRARRKVQEENISLRGKSYKERQKKQEEVIQQLKSLYP